MLPLQSATFGTAAEAVEAGFRAAADLATSKVEVIPHGDGDVLAAIDKARAAQVKVIAGPLLRDDVKALASMTQPLPWTIALNQLEEDVTLPDHVYTLALSIEGEARQIARTMQAEGVRDVAVIAGDSALQRRFASSFTSEWILLGGGPPSTYNIVRATEMLATLRQELGRVAPNAIVLAADAADAALVKPYLPRATVYASSQINEPKAVPIMSDLDDIHFVEVPWLVEPDAPQFAGIPRPQYASTTLERLYALGLDAFAVAQAFDHGAPQRLEIEGATGHLTLDGRHHIVREGRLAHLEGGHLVPDPSH
ncbi:MAG TPA: penicillin-binding protein activator [Casimicrobiaceae bacterium]|nr:penicillin-binding protein activator [Casimicrobiaceae bacterium]